MFCRRTSQKLLTDLVSTLVFEEPPPCPPPDWPPPDWPPPDWPPLHRRAADLALTPMLDTVSRLMLT